ncbi:hypothetical protein WICMUC_005025 [Wickerhamomyces mucosus]|uniref:DNA mismatch repair protein PMS1 n=1 Tax=Wickerhamomyces mucosus TaxID=1378264 RepID=A0A9P8T8N5_9ASCO|nr:hypothetical protein WICMUC_005025 [Wickerhamomyces mucosus]
MSINPISIEDIHRITSSQVIIDLTSAVKELVENSLDANANVIEIVFNNYGLNSIEIIDNGSGISDSDFEGVASKNHTSKISNFEDISKINTLGFRGEAINSLCSISHVKITTTQSPPKATILEFDSNGAITSQKVCSRVRGTTVCISNLFHSLPVRQKDFNKNFKREFSKCLTILQSYSIIHTGTKFSVFNINNKNKKHLVLKTQGMDQIKDNLLNVFGSNGAFGMIPIEIELNLNKFKSLSSFKIDPSGSLDYLIQVTGLISKNSNGFGRATNDRQYLYINKRPISLVKINKILNEVYKFYNLNQLPCFVLNFQIHPSFFDVNVTPDKRTILLHNESKVFEELKEQLIKFFDQQDYNLSKNFSSQQISSETSTFKDSLVEEEADEYDSTTSASFGNIFSFKDTQDTAVHDKSFTESLSTESLKVKSHLSFKHDNNKSSQVSYSEENGFTDKSYISDLNSSAQSEQKYLNVDGDENSDLEQISQVQEIEAEEEEEKEEESEIPVQAKRTRTLDLLSSLPISKKSKSIQPQPFKHLIKDNTKKITDIRDLGSFRNGATSISSSSSLRSRKTKQSTLEPILIKIGDEEVEEKASFKNGVLSFQDHQDKNDDKYDDDNGDEHYCSHCSDSDYTTDDHDHHQMKDVEPNLNEDSQAVRVNNGKEHGIEEHETEKQILEIDAGLDHKEGQLDTCEIEQIYAVEKDMSCRSSNRNDVAKDKIESLSRNKNLDAILNLQASALLPTKLLSTNDLLIGGNASKKKSSRQVAIDDISDQEMSEKTLTLTVSKNDFLNMKIIGQFNLGFILVIRNLKDLFIIDQHASDEKYNFEDLNKNTVFESQYLVKPKILELTVVDELTVIENEDVFTKNGFKFEVLEDNLPGSKIQLVSLPLSKKTLFDLNDFYELIYQIKENPGQCSSIRCSKISSMFAMRSCRKSIMVGKPLSFTSMSKVVKNLATLEKPWNCPHGRPTMRHLLELQSWDTFKEDYKL